MEKPSGHWTTAWNCNGQPAGCRLLHCNTGRPAGRKQTQANKQTNKGTAAPGRHTKNGGMEIEVKPKKRRRKSIKQRHEATNKQDAEKPGKQRTENGEQRARRNA